MNANRSVIGGAARPDTGQTLARAKTSLLFHHIIRSVVAEWPRGPKHVAEVE